MPDADFAKRRCHHSLGVTLKERAAHAFFYLGEDPGCGGLRHADHLSSSLQLTGFRDFHQQVEMCWFEVTG